MRTEQASDLAAAARGSRDRLLRPSAARPRWRPDLSAYNGPLYRRLADAITEAVALGRLEAGDKLPTHRELAAHLHVTLRTVTRAYGETALRGVTTGTAGSGTFVAVKQAAAAILPSDVPMPAGTIDLALNVVPLGRHLNLFRRGIAAVSAAAELEQVLTYMPPQGAARHRETGAAWAAQRGLAADPAHVTLCCGTQHALLVALLHLARPGDTVFAEALNYPGVRHLAAQLHLRLHGIPTDLEGMVPEALEERCRKERPAAMIVTPSGHNPTTATMPAARRLALAEVLSRHGIPFIEDDVCGHVVAAASPPISRQLPALGHYICGVSKCLAPGLRVSYLISPPGACRALSGILHATTWSASNIAAELATYWIGNGTALRLAAWHRKEAARRLALVAAALPGTVLRSTAGVYHGWLTPPPPWRGVDFANQLAHAGVHVSPAEVFAVDESAVPQAVRITLGGELTDSRLERAMRIIRGVLDRDPADAFTKRLV